MQGSGIFLLWSAALFRPRMRKRCRELLRAEIAETVAGPDAVEEELRDLFAALSA